MVHSYRPSDLEITITSARNLKNVNWKHGDLCAYAVAWVDPDVKVTTKIDESGDTDPCWNEKFTLSVTKPVEEAVLTIEIYHDKSSDLSKPIVGTATLSLMELVDAGGFEEKQLYTLKLHRPSGRPHGKLEISARLREKRMPPPSAYPTAPPYGQGYYPAPSGQTRDWQGYPPYSSPYPAYGQGPPPSQAPYSAYPQAPPSSQPGYPPPYAAPPSGYPSYPYGPAQPAYVQSQPAPSYQPAPYSYQDSGSSGYTAQPAAKQGSKFGGLGAGLAVGALAGAVGGIALEEYVHHEEDEAAEKQEEEDDRRYAAEEDAGNDYGDDGGYGDEDF